MRTSRPYSVNLRSHFVRLIPLIALSATPVDVAVGQAARPLTIDDVFAIRTLTTVSPSPTGDWLAVIVQRSWAESPAYRPYDMMGDDHADVWLLPKRGGTARNLTLGAARGLGYWNPVWSPDGRNLAVLTTECGGSIGLALVNARSGARKCLSERAVDTRPPLGGGIDEPNPVHWLDDEHVLVSLLPAGVQASAFGLRRYTPSLARAGWEQAHKGQAPSVSVLSTELDSTLTPRASQLVSVDIRTARAVLLFEGPVSDAAVAPRRDELAIATARRTLVRVNLSSGAQDKRTTLGDIDALHWTSTGRLLARQSVPGAPRFDWWLIGATLGADRVLTGGLRESSDRNVMALGDSALVVAAGGKLWRVALGAAQLAPLAAINDGLVTRIIAPTRHDATMPGHGRIVVGIRQGIVRTLYELDLESNKWTPIESPSTRARLAAFEPAARRAYFIADEPDGTVLSAVTPTSTAAERLLTLNEHLVRAATSRRLLLRYRAANGDSLSAVVLLPPQYVPNKRFPMVTWVYPGVIVSDTANATVDFWLAKNHAHTDNLHLLAASGYAVLVPSMPRGPMPRDPYTELPNGVLPAVSAAVAAGIADSARVAVMGQSFGGYATFGLITQSDRFAAAIAISGFSDLLSNYGTFDGERRYRADAHLARVQARFSEGDVIGLRAPPWADIERYVRNSPLLHVAKVRTPVLIIHGDLDYVPIQQSEEFFTALQRLGRPAQFARYWGESHGATDSSANARDRWERVLAWLARWLKST